MKKTTSPENMRHVVVVKEQKYHNGATTSLLYWHDQDEDGPYLRLHVVRLNGDNRMDGLVAETSPRLLELMTGNGFVLEDEEEKPNHTERVWVQADFVEKYRTRKIIYSHHD